MVTREQISALSARYIEANGLRVVAGDAGVGDLLVPYLLMDAEYSLYQKYVTKVSAKRELKKVKGAWVEAYGLFNRAFFSAFGEEQRDVVVDLMDEYEEWVGNSVEIARITVMNEIGKEGYDLDEQELLGACLMCNCLSQCANIVWETIHVDARGMKRKSDAIERVEWCSKRFADVWMEQRGDRKVINLNENKKVNAAMNALVSKIVRFPKLRMARDLQGGEDNGE